MRRDDDFIKEHTVALENLHSDAPLEKWLPVLAEGRIDWPRESWGHARVELKKRPAELKPLLESDDQRKEWLALSAFRSLGQAPPELAPALQVVALRLGEAIRLVRRSHPAGDVDLTLMKYL